MANKAFHSRNLLVDPGKIKFTLFASYIRSYYLFCNAVESNMNVNSLCDDSAMIRLLSKRDEMFTTIMNELKYARNAVGNVKDIMKEMDQYQLDPDTKSTILKFIRQNFSIND